MLYCIKDIIVWKPHSVVIPLQSSRENLVSCECTYYKFFFFRWVFVERYSSEEAKNYAILIAFVCAVITWGAFG